MDIFDIMGYVVNGTRPDDRDVIDVDYEDVTNDEASLEDDGFYEPTYE